MFKYPVKPQLTINPTEYVVEYVNLADTIKAPETTMTIENGKEEAKLILRLLSDVSEIMYNRIADYHNFLIDHPSLSINDFITERNEAYSMRIFDFEFFTQPYYVSLLGQDLIGYYGYIVRLTETGELYKSNGLLRISCEKEYWLDNIIKTVQTYCVNTYAWILIFPDSITGFNTDTIQYIKNQTSSHVFEEIIGNIQQLPTHITPDQYTIYEPITPISTLNYKKSVNGKSACFYGGSFILYDNSFKITNGLTTMYNLSMFIV